MVDKKWKQQERRVSAWFGSRRTPLSGSNSQHGTESDSLHPRLYIECKYRKQLAIFDEWPSVLEKANKENKIPILSIKTMQIKDDVILIRLKDLDRIIEERKHALSQKETTMEEAVLEEEQVHG